jgi:hypothetical protein
MLRAIGRLVFGLLLLMPAAAMAAAGYVHDLTGKSTVLASPKGVPQALKVGDLIESGSTIRTEAGSSAVIKFEDGQVMVMRENTGFVVSDYVYNKEKISQSRAVFNLLAGGLRFITGVIGATNKSSFRLNVGTTVTIGVRGSDGDASYDPVTEAVTAAVNAGAIVMQNRFGERLIAANSYATSSRTGAPSESLPIIRAPLAVRQAVERSLAHANVPINTPVVLRASANAAVAQAQARQAEIRAAEAKAAAEKAAAAAVAAAAQNQANAQALAAQARAAEAAAKAAADLAATAEQRAQQTLGVAVSAAQAAYSQAINSGASRPEPPAPPPPTVDPNKLPPTSAGPTQTQQQPSTSGTTSTPSGGAGGGSGGGGGGTASPN